MGTNTLLSIFISSKMQELVDERQEIQHALRQFHILGWLWETEAGARPEPIRSVYLKEVEASDIYVGLFWLGYGEYTVEEFEHARHQQKPCLIYEKHTSLPQRDTRLQAFLDRIQRVTDPGGLTVFRFETPHQVARQVQKDIVRVLSTHFRERVEPSTLTSCSQQMRVASPATQIKLVAKQRGIAINNMYGDVEQHGFSHTEQE